MIQLQMTPETQALTRTLAALVLQSACLITAVAAHESQMLDMRLRIAKFADPLPLLRSLDM